MFGDHLRFLLSNLCSPIVQYDEASSSFVMDEASFFIVMLCWIALQIGWRCSEPLM
jgi:hypothetical protein